MSEINTLVQNINEQIIGPIILLLFVLSTVIFLWGAVDFIRNASGGEAREVGRQHMLWGILGVFIMASAWAIIQIALYSIGGDAGTLPQGLF